MIFRLLLELRFLGAKKEKKKTKASGIYPFFTLKKDPES